MFQLFLIELKCQICGVKTGEHRLSSRYGWTNEILNPKVYEAKFGITDIRCTPCEKLHGNYKKMTEEYEQQFAKTSAEAELFVKKHKKREDFDKEIKNMELGKKPLKDYNLS